MTTTTLIDRVASAAPAPDRRTAVQGVHPEPAPAPQRHAHVIRSAEEALEAARQFAQEIAPGAQARDRERTLPWQEVERFSQSGHIDADLYEVFVKGEVFRRYAEAFLRPQQIDC